MIKKSLTLCASVVLLLNITGCVALLAGAAGGAGTAVWLSNKLVKEVDASQVKTVKAVKSALSDLGLGIEKETVTDDVVQIISENYDGKKIWIDVHKVTEEKARLEVRVGMLGDEEAARKIMEKIEDELKSWF